jgi:DNA-binding beta-propeller fold protein YncE
MIALSLLISFAAAPLMPAETVDFAGKGKFDYMAVDSKYHRVLATHTGEGALTVYDMSTKKVSDIKTGVVNGVIVCDKLGKIFVAGGGQKLIALDQKTLKSMGEVSFDGPCDDIVLDSKRNKIYVCHDDGTEDWVVDAMTLKVEKSIKVDEAPEFVLYSATTDKIYQNIKSTDKLQVIDPEKGEVVAEWMTAPEKGPHGLAINEKTGHVISVGSNGKADVFDLTTGKLLMTLDVQKGVDQIAFDEENQRVYCAARGFISVIQDSADGAKSIGDVVSPAGAHTITVDPATHDVWVCYGSEAGSHLARFTVGS